MPTPSRPNRSSSTLMPPTIRCMATRKASSSMATTTAIATCRSTSSAAGTCWRQKMRRANVDAAAGAVEETARLVAQIRRRWPRVRILLRGDSGFCRDALMAWCEANRVDYVFGLARNERLEQALVPEVITATIESLRTGRTARCFKDFRYATRDSWSRERRVIGKAEVTGGEANPRFIVTSLKRSEAAARQLYEHVYCARGDMENRIKECQLDLFADRTSTATMGCFPDLC